MGRLILPPPTGDYEKDIANLKSHIAHYNNMSRIIIWVTVIGVVIIVIALCIT